MARPRARRGPTPQFRAGRIPASTFPVTYRRMRLADPDLAESIVRAFLLHHAQADDLQVSFHAQALLARLYRTSYPLLLERLTPRLQTLIEALKKK